MKLYEVNQQIEDLMVQLEPDPETGEIPANEDELIEQINAALAEITAEDRNALMDNAVLNQPVLAE